MANATTIAATTWAIDFAPSVHLGLENSRSQPPNQSVKCQKIGSEERIRDGSPEEQAHFHDLSGRDAVGDHQAEKDHAKRCEPKQPRWLDEKSEGEGKKQRESQRRKSADQNEGELRMLPA